LGTREKQRFQGYLSTPGLFSNPSAPANFFPSKNVGIGGLDRFATDCVTFYSEAKFLLPMRNEVSIGEQPAMGRTAEATLWMRVESQQPRLTS
jgi:hypothetical protein